MTDLDALARDYSRAVNAAASASIDGEEEAQLTVPVSNLFCALVATAGLGRMDLIRETRLEGSRPDFAAVLTIGRARLQKGYVELKAPHVPTDVTQWRGRNARQWTSMSAAGEIIIVCNGREARLYLNGNDAGCVASLPYDDAGQWQAAPLIALLRRFLEARIQPVVSVTDLSRRLATRTADLRDRLLWLLGQEGVAGRSANQGLAAWRVHVNPHATPRDFADGISQVLAYGMVLAVLTGDAADQNGDGHITVGEARAAIRGTSPVLAAAFAPLIDKPELASAVEIEIGALETLISAIDAERVNISADRRGDPWLYFYEDFLEVYDPEERRQAGVYYTPIAIVEAMVAMTSHLLTTRFGRRMGFADPGVVTLDPATGTGTFPLAAIDRGVATATAVRGAAGPQQAVDNFARNLFAFELLPGAYSVAHLRLSQRFAQLSEGRVEAAQVILTDTLESPLSPPDYGTFFGDAEILAAEQVRASGVKLDQRVTVVIGNPPYRRVERDVRGRGSGGWVLDGIVPGRDGEASLFEDILSIARANTIFSHHASLYNLYVYFWRWAIWKAFEAHGDGPGIVTMITGSSWLTGPGFVGLRQLVREICDDIWVIDLGGDNRGANPEENVFAIETPVAVVVLVHNGATRRDQPGVVHYRRITGTTEEKLEAMREVAQAADPFAGEWLDATTAWMGPLSPATGGTNWQSMPMLTDIFPFQIPGCKFNRTWPIAPAASTLLQRWQNLMQADGDTRAQRFAPGATGRTVDTRVGGMPIIRNLPVDAPHQPIVRYGFRSFDRQFTFEDPRLINLERPSLWSARSQDQIYLASLLTGHIGEGPAISASSDVPDLHFFRGSFGGKDIIPLWRNAAATEPNLTAALPEVLAARVGIAAPGVNDVASYCYALLSASAYQARFAEELRTPGVRVPMTEDPILWSEAVEHGTYLLWLHTYAERLSGADKGRPAQVPLIEGIGWQQPVRQMPETMAEIRYDSDTHLLVIGDGQVTGVRPDVWAYSVSGMAVLPKWLGYRTRRGAGRAASSQNVLDRIRPEAWVDEWNDELLDLIRILTLTLDRQPALADLLERICDGPLIDAADLPVPTDFERLPPGARIPEAVSPGLALEGGSNPRERRGRS